MKEALIYESNLTADFNLDAIIEKVDNEFEGVYKCVDGLLSPGQTITIYTEGTYPNIVKARFSALFKGRGWVAKQLAGNKFVVTKRE